MYYCPSLLFVVPGSVETMLEWSGWVGGWCPFDSVRPPLVTVVMETDRREEEEEEPHCRRQVGWSGDR